METENRPGYKCFLCGKELAPNFKDSGIFCWSGFLSVDNDHMGYSPYFNQIHLCDKCHETVLNTISEIVETKPSTEAE